MERPSRSRVSTITRRSSYAAAKHVPEEYRLLHRGAFQRGAFQASAFDTGNSADLEAWLSGLYVDWKNGWRRGVRVDPSLLRGNIVAVRDLISRKRIELA